VREKEGTIWVLTWKMTYICPKNVFDTLQRVLIVILLITETRQVQYGKRCYC